MKILIVSPFFPPSATVAIVRISSLAKELLKKGHELTIIRNEYDERIDKLSNSDVELINLKTYTVKVNQSVRYFEASKRYKEVFREIMDQKNFDLVFITAGPYYTIPLCKVAKEEYNTKCIIDYRDLWIFDMRNKIDFFKPINLIKKLVYLPIERRNIKCADLVVTVTEEWRQILKKVYKREEFEVITNGYDDEQLKNITNTVDYPYHDRLVIAVFGKLSYYSVEYGIKFFSAMDTLSKKYPNLLVLHIGLPEKETEEAMRISGFDLEKYVNTGFVNYTNGIELLKNSNACVIIDIRKGAMGTKFYDYVFVNKPLIYLGKKNTHLDRLVQRFENGFSCYTEKDLMEAVSKVEEDSISLLTNAGNAEKYSRSIQNKKYIELIDNLF
ncbi:glycosyltransferase [Cytobacillus horneckiae]|uniref:glycosyltransferase n=1 Tax=Cytobacillus horneckiae TaxID=549687 RepID=UPI000825EFD7|nr:glycosyltransferase [Cytobacillus horneckiae]MEC1154372.1 glycosyltransferase [Cytobacillus horneckiae]MED2937707.1 glycosyltransferase [Cytobacillus horneckiae]